MAYRKYVQIIGDLLGRRHHLNFILNERFHLLFQHYNEFKKGMRSTPPGGRLTWIEFGIRIHIGQSVNQNIHLG